MEIGAFGQAVTWDVDLLEGYRAAFLSRATRAHPNRRATMSDPSIVPRLRPDTMDVLVLFGWAYPTEWLAAAIAGARGIPYLLYTDTDVRDAAASKRLQRVRRAVVGTLISRAAGALYTGIFNRDYYLHAGMPPERLWFSPMSVDNERFAAGDRVASRRRLGLRPDVCYALFVGSMIERKRPVGLVEALARLQRRGLPAGAIFAGSGPLEHEIRHRASDLNDVHFLGFVNQERLPHIYAAADIFVLPSTRDPRGTVVNEAMAAGLPVVVTHGTGVWGPGDLVQHGREGFVVAVGDDRALSEALDRLLDPRLRYSMGQAALRRLDSWNYDVAAAGWEAAAVSVASATHSYPTRNWTERR
jgi:glycosyltransferase involved in cell wall biosynthesis